MSSGIARSASPEAARWTASARHRHRSRPALDPVRQTGVESSSARREQPGVCRILDERVAEPPRPVAVRHDERGLDEPVERARRDLALEQVLDVAVAEADPDDRRDAEDVPRRLVEPVDARPEHGPQRQRQLGSARFDEHHPPVAQLERPVLDRRPDGLADEQRVALGPLVDLARVVGSECGARDDRRELRRFRGRESRQVDPFDVRRAWTRRARDPGASSR